jgi:hypothetical protein
MRRHLHAYTCRIYMYSFRVSIGFQRYLPPYPKYKPRMRFLFVRPAFCLRLPSHIASQQCTCRLANDSPYRAHRRLSLLSVCALPGAQKERGLQIANPIFLCAFSQVWLLRRRFRRYPVISVRIPVYRHLAIQHAQHFRAPRCVFMLCGPHLQICFHKNIGHGPFFVSHGISSGVFHFVTKSLVHQRWSESAG